MKPELDALLKAYDAFKQAPEGPEATSSLSDLGEGRILNSF
jgi:hypothetical protein